MKVPIQPAKRYEKGEPRQKHTYRAARRLDQKLRHRIAKRTAQALKNRS